MTAEQRKTELLQAIQQSFETGILDLEAVAANIGAPRYYVWLAFNEGLRRKLWGITIVDPADDGPELDILRNPQSTELQHFLADKVRREEREEKIAKFWDGKSED